MSFPVHHGRKHVRLYCHRLRGSAVGGGRGARSAWALAPPHALPGHRHQVLLPRPQPQSHAGNVSLPLLYMPALLLLAFSISILQDTHTREMREVSLVQVQNSNSLASRRSLNHKCRQPVPSCLHGHHTGHLVLDCPRRAPPRPSLDRGHDPNHRPWT